MTTLIVLFNLKPGVSVEEYETFARTTDLPIVRKLPSVASFEVYKSSGLMGGGAAPYQYVEIIQLKSLEGLGKDASTPTMKEVAGAFRKLADDPKFMVTELI
jgi:hypothetical protein